jgi:hypothetical protein
MCVKEPIAVGPLLAQGNSVWERPRGRWRRGSNRDVSTRPTMDRAGSRHMLCGATINKQERSKCQSRCRTTELTINIELAALRLSLQDLQ